MTSVKLDSIDLRILEAVQHDGRITKVALAERVGLSGTPCWMRLRRLEKAGLITGYHARIAIRSIVPMAAVLLEVTLATHRQLDLERFERAVSDIPEVVACWSVGGGVDYILKVITSDIDSYQRLVDDLLSKDLRIDRYFSYVVTRTVKDDVGIPIQHLMSYSGAPYGVSTR